MTDTHVLDAGCVGVGADITNRQVAAAEVGSVVWIEHMIDRRGPRTVSPR
ncbi:hypothetical protein [Mycolicibacterium hippocampi]|nr:hypothetical protein [Mycolicibacterium hippocampi]